jgi:hypothetical protein
MMTVKQEAAKNPGCISCAHHSEHDGDHRCLASGSQDWDFLRGFTLKHNRCEPLNNRGQCERWEGVKDD